jgi:hypothetical protein
MRLANLDAQWLNGYTTSGALLVGHGGQPLRMVDPVSGTVLGQLDGVESIVPNVSGAAGRALPRPQHRLVRPGPPGARRPEGGLAPPAGAADRGRRYKGPTGVVIARHRATEWANTEHPDHWQLTAKSIDLDGLHQLGEPFTGSRGSTANAAISADGHRIVQIGNVSTRFYDVATRTELGARWRQPMAWPTVSGASAAPCGAAGGRQGGRRPDRRRRPRVLGPRCFALGGEGV